MRARPPLRENANFLSGFGRYGDTEIAHVARGDVVIPRKIAQRDPEIMRRLRQGMAEMGADYRTHIVGSGKENKNPVTGKPEFFFNKIGDFLGNVVSGVGNGIGQFTGGLYKAAGPVLEPISDFLGPVGSAALGTVVGGVLGGPTGALQGLSTGLNANTAYRGFTYVPESKSYHIGDKAPEGAGIYRFGVDYKDGKPYIRPRDKGLGYYSKVGQNLGGQVLPQEVADFVNKQGDYSAQGLRNNSVDWVFEGKDGRYTPKGAYIGLFDQPEAPVPYFNLSSLSNKVYSGGFDPTPQPAPAPPPPPPVLPVTSPPPPPQPAPAPFLETPKSPPVLPVTAPASQEAPSGFLSNLDNLQRRSAIATRGTQGMGISDAEQSYYFNLLRRYLAGANGEGGQFNTTAGNLRPLSGILPVESQFLSRAGYNQQDTESLLAQLEKR